MLELCTVVEMELELASLKAASNRETTDASRHEKASNLTGKNFFLFFFWQYSGTTKNCGIMYVQHFNRKCARRTVPGQQHT